MTLYAVHTHFDCLLPGTAQLTVRALLRKAEPLEEVEGEMWQLSRRHVNIAEPLAVVFARA